MISRPGNAWRATVAAVGVTAACLVLFPGPRPGAAAQEADPDAPAAREWNQPGGDAGHTGWSPCRPIRAEPSVLWRVDLGGDLLAGPVTWAGTAYVVTGTSRSRDLYAFRIADGAEVGKRSLGAGGQVELAVWQDMVLVAEDGNLKVHRHQGGRFGTGWSAKAERASGGLPTVRGGLVLGAGYGCRDATTGRKSDPVVGGYGSPAIVLAGEELRAAVPWFATEDGKDPPGPVLVWVAPVARMSSSPEKHDVKDAGPLSMRTKGVETGARVCAMGDKGWIVCAPAAEGRWNCRVLARAGAPVGGVFELSWPPVVVGDRGFGFTPDGALVSIGSGGRSGAIFEAGKLPADAHPAPLSAAGDVLYSGNWALDLTLTRRLWGLTDVAPRSALIPAGDELALCVDGSGALVCLGSADAAAAAGSGPDTDAALAAPIPVSPPPDDRDGVLLADGRQFAGDFRRVGDDRLRVEPKEGEAFEVALSDVAVAEAAGVVEVSGEPHLVFQVWRDAALGAWVETLVQRFDLYLSKDLANEGARILEEARTLGLDARRHGVLKSRLARARQHPNADLRFKKFAAEEAELRLATHGVLLQGSRWCLRRRFPAAATALLGVADRFLPDACDEVALAKDLVPAGFPWRDEPDAAARWLVWAPEILPASAEFVDPGDGTWSRAQWAPWNSETILLRTPNLLFFSRTDDPRMVGGCLRAGEGAVRACQHLLNDGAREYVGGDDDRLDIRLHRNRKDFLTERTPGGFALPWSAGYYSPSEGVSRFHVPGEGMPTAPVERNLFETLSHEITHHYIAQRWLPRQGDAGYRTGDLPGYWVVEGMARFVEDQAVEMGRRGIRFDDPTVSSLDACAQAAAAGRIFPAAELVDMDGRHFHELDDDGVLTVRLRNSAHPSYLTRRAIFYEQAGSLVFFLMNRRGDDGRRRLVRYMRSYYQGTCTADGWRDLGFESAEDLHAQFANFLSSLR